MPNFHRTEFCHSKFCTFQILPPPSPSTELIYPLMTQCLNPWGEEGGSWVYDAEPPKTNIG